MIAKEGEGKTYLPGKFMSEKSSITKSELIRTMEVAIDSFPSGRLLQCSSLDAQSPLYDPSPTVGRLPE